MTALTRECDASNEIECVYQKGETVGRRGEDSAQSAAELPALNITEDLC